MKIYPVKGPIRWVKLSPEELNLGRDDEGWSHYLKEGNASFQLKFWSLQPSIFEEGVDIGAVVFQHDLQCI